MQAPLLHKIHHQNLWLSSQRSIYWEEKKTLIVSDLHFGKTGHFRKSGIAVPQNIYKEDLQRLVGLINHFKPDQLLVVGDFFHSHANVELDWFKKWREDLSETRIILVRGNHDILQQKWYQQTSIEIVEDELELGSFIFTHDKCREYDDHFVFCGHLHPGVYVEGLGKQALRLPCFYFSENQCILPAFSKFTGMALVEPGNGDIIYAIADDQLIRIR